MAYLVAECYVCNAKEHLSSDRLASMMSTNQAAEWKPVGWQEVFIRTVCPECASLVYDWLFGNAKIVKLADLDPPPNSTPDSADTD